MLDTVVNLFACPPDVSDPWWRAAAMATQAHAGQFRADGRTPYIIHPLRVAATTVITFGCDDPDVPVVALLHDVLERSRVSRSDLQHAFGATVTRYVEQLSHPPARDPDWHQLAAADWQVRLVKIADVCDNLHDGHGPLPQRVEKLRLALPLASGSQPAILHAHNHLLYLLDDCAVVRLSGLLLDPYAPC